MVKVGDQVWWYTKGNVNADPLPALVVVKHPAGTLSVEVTMHGGMKKWIPCLFHKDSQANQKVRERDGVWADPYETAQAEIKPEPKVFSESPKSFAEAKKLAKV